MMTMIFTAFFLSGVVSAAQGIDIFATVAKGSNSCSAEITPNQDCSDGDLNSVKGSSPDDCCVACASTDGCGAFVFVSGGTYGNMCYLKTTCSPKAGCASGSCTTGLLTSAPPTPPTPSPPTPPPSPNPFEGIDSVKVFTPDQAAEIQAALNPMLPIPSDAGGERLAVLLEPGDYGNTELHVGYFTSVAGLGKRPTDVKNGNIRIDTEGSNRGDTTTIFWRSVENMETDMNTHCSQGIAFRRILSNNFIHNDGNDVDDHGGGSGGFIADCRANSFQVGGQQYFVRNTQASQLSSSTWISTLFLGCEGDQVASSAEIAYIDQTPAIAEKPYITKDVSGKWSLVKPKLRINAQGPSFDSNGDPVGEEGEYIDFSEVYVAKQGATAADINAQIAAGKHIVLSPYVYHLEDSIRLSHSGTVFLGLGLATLECASRKPCLVMGAVDDVRVAGVTVIGGAETTNDVWVQIGDPSGYEGNPSKPSVLSDNHLIVGYYRNNSVHSTVQVNNGNVIIDHSWSWRSDIDGAQGESRNGFEVNGDDVKAYGLFSEHHWQYSLAWYGNRGEEYFYQCETPWDAAKGALQDWQQDESTSNTWRNWPAPNWYTIKPRCYYVDDSVENHLGVAVGAYSMEGGGCKNWCNCQPTQVLDTHIQIPNSQGVSLFRATCWKNCGGGVQHCVNNGIADTDGTVHTNWCQGNERPDTVSLDVCMSSASMVIMP